MHIVQDLERDGWECNGSSDAACCEWVHDTRTYRARLEIEWYDGVSVCAQVTCVVGVVSTTPERTAFLKSCAEHLGFDGLAVYHENGLPHLHAHFAIQESLIIRGGFRTLVQTRLIETIEALVDYYNSFERISPFVTPALWCRTLRERYASHRNDEPCSDEEYLLLLTRTLGTPSRA